VGQLRNEVFNYRLSLQIHSCFLSKYSVSIMTLCFIRKQLKLGFMIDYRLLNSMYDQGYIHKLERGLYHLSDEFVFN